MKHLREYQLYRRRITGHEVYGKRYEPPIVGYKDPAFIFVQIDTQHNFVERWTVFAGLWFEEIEPLLGSLGAGVIEGSKIKLGLESPTTG